MHTGRIADRWVPDAIGLAQTFRSAVLYHARKEHRPEGLCPRVSTFGFTARPQLITALSKGRGYGEAGGEGLVSSCQISEPLTHQPRRSPLCLRGELPFDSDVERRRERITRSCGNREALPLDRLWKAEQIGGGKAISQHLWSCKPVGFPKCGLSCPGRFTAPGRCRLPVSSKGHLMRETLTVERP
jgi:hypothetical protein